MKTTKYKKYMKGLVVLLFTLSFVLYKGIYIKRNAMRYALPFIASIDTMKLSRDTATQPLSMQEITRSVDALTSLNTNYITVDTQWDYPNYMAEWIKAIRSVKRHVWFRIYPKQWEDPAENAAIMTPTQYLLSERTFILAHSSFFQAGDILDPCAEPENGLYWNATYGENWTSNAPNTATAAYNAFLRQTTNTANDALSHDGSVGVITTIRSIDSFIATHPAVLEQATVNMFGSITVDSYPDQDTVIPAVAARARVTELTTIEALWHVPIVIGEMGYSNQIPVDDAVQHAVLKEEFTQLQALPYLIGMNYWVGMGSSTAGGYTYLLIKKDKSWILRPAACDLATFDLTMLAEQRPSSKICAQYE